MQVEAHSHCPIKFNFDLSALCTGQTAFSSLPLSVPGQRRSPRAGSAHSLYCSGVQYGASPTKERRQEDRWRLKGSCSGVAVCKKEAGRWDSRMRHPWCPKSDLLSSSPFKNPPLLLVDIGRNQKTRARNIRNEVIRDQG